MARYRIVEKPSFADPSEPIFAVEKRVWFWWEYAGLFGTFAEAFKRGLELQEADRKGVVKIKVVEEFN